eukprot:Nitzschia sp. Nitz4//scaffold85_size83877//76066//77013//NITZ4_005242-RA/size83877-processed-gene-0.130-mRNA-1//1//CDS//3329559176//4213//frame0
MSSTPLVESPHLTFEESYIMKWSLRGRNRNSSTHAVNEVKAPEPCGADSSPRSVTHPTLGYDSPTTVQDYGYGDAAPDSANIYGYGDAAPDSDKYGYGDAVPDSEKYGYGDGAPTRRSRAGSSSPRPSSKTPRRSSMKQGPESTRRRRASIQLTGEVENYLPGREEPVRRRTSISFDNKVKVKKVTAVSDLAEEPQSLWFQDDEYHSIKQKLYSIVDKVESGNTDAGRYCTRGLERMMKSESVRMKKYKVWDSLLDEQDVQREKGADYDDVYMANVCRFASAGCQREAAERAQQDAVAVEKYMANTRRYCRRLSC